MKSAVQAISSLLANQPQKKEQLALSLWIHKEIIKNVLQ